MLIDKRRAGLSQFVEESTPVLVDFLERLNLIHGGTRRGAWRNLIAPVSDWLTNQAIDDEEDRVWITTRIGYLLGELLVEEYLGCWFLDEDDGSPFHADYVVGRFAHAANRQVRISPIALAMVYVRSPPGRNLMGLLNTIEESLHGERRTD